MEFCFFPLGISLILSQEQQQGKIIAQVRKNNNIYNKIQFRILCSPYLKCWKLCEYNFGEWGEKTQIQASPNHQDDI